MCAWLAEFSRTHATDASKIVMSKVTTCGQMRNGVLWWEENSPNSKLVAGQCVANSERPEPM